MQLSFHVIGDIEFLAAILNGIAMLFSSADLRTASAIGALIGILLLCLRALLEFDGRGPRVSEFLAALLLWLLLFEPRATVTLEDAYSGSARVVANVPLGPAVAGSIISDLGWGLTRLFETAFSTPAMTQTGYAGSLETLSHLRRQIQRSLSLGRFERGPTGMDIPGSMESYVRDCTLTGVDLGRTSLGDLIGKAQMPLALRFDSDIYTTRILDGHAPSQITCTAAWPRVLALVEGSLTEQLRASLSGFFEMNGAEDPVSRIQSALDALTRGEMAAGDYMLSAVLVPLFEQGVLGRHRDARDAGRVAMVETAIQQRNTQWAAEQTLFGRIVRPMLTWIEGFSYAITPIMAFTVFLGARGIRMCGQYGLMLIWIQLWMPLLAIGNLYVTKAAEGAISHLYEGQYAAGSIAGTYQLDMELQNWIAVGGMLASSTPAIALMLVYGGSITATHFLGRFQGGDFIDEKLASPALAQSAPLIAFDPRNRHSPLSGLGAAGGDQLLPSFSMGKDLSLTESSAALRSDRHTQSLMEGIRQAHSKSQGLATESSHGMSSSEQYSGGTSATDRLIEARGEALARKYHDSGLSGEDFASLIGGSLSGRWQGGSASSGGSFALGTDAGLSSAIQQRFHLGSDRADEIASEIRQSTGEDRSFQSALARTITEDHQEGSRSIGSLGIRSESIGDLAKTAASVLESSNTHREETTDSLTFGSEHRIGAKEAALSLIRHPEGLQSLDEALKTVGLSGDAERLAHEWQHQGLIVDPDQAHAAAGLSLLSGQSDPVYHALGEEEAVLAATLGRTLLGETLRSPYVREDLFLKQDLPELPPIDPDGLRERADERLSGVEQRTDEEVAAGVSELRAASIRAITEAPGRAREIADPDTPERSRFETSAEDRLDEQRKQLLERQLRAAGADGSLSAQLGETVRDFINQAGNGFDAVAEGLGDGASLIARGLEQGKSPGEVFEELKSHYEGRLASRIDQHIARRIGCYEDDLTQVETRYLEALMRAALAGNPGDGGIEDASGNLGAARKALEAEAGGIAPSIAAILGKMAAGERRDLSGLLRAYQGLNSTGRP